jgi:two-component system LytT family response regulator
MPAEAAPAESTPSRLRVLVVDDEAPIRRHVQALLGRAPDVDVVAAAEDGLAAVDAIRRLAPDVVFLDVQMPGLSGMDVVRAVGAAMPPTVFVTAHDRYAVDAFDVAAVDYLVKPFDDERFARALVRAREAVARRAGGRDAAATEAIARGAYLERIAVQIRGELRPVLVDDIERITASGVYAELHVGGRSHLVRESLQKLEEALDPAEFLRVHRSAIVRLDRVTAFRRVPGGDAEVRLHSGVWVRVSRRRRDALERWLHGRPA